MHKDSLGLLASCNPSLTEPRRWNVTHNPVMAHLTSRLNFRIRLLLGCHGLESDTSTFRRRRGDKSPGDPSCDL